MDPALLEIICCPLTHQMLRPADPANLGAASRTVARPIGEGLLREDGKVLYPISKGIPLLVPDAGIALTAASPDADADPGPNAL